MLRLFRSLASAPLNLNRLVLLAAAALLITVITQRLGLTRWIIVLIPLSGICARIFDARNG